MKSILLMITAAFAALVAGTAHAGPALFTKPGIHSISAWRMSGNDQIAARLVNGNTITVPLADVIALIDLPGAPRNPGLPLVTLQNGECIDGAILPAGANGSMKFQGGAFGDCEFARADIHDIRITGVPYPRAKGSAPCVIPANGDLISGEIKSVTSEGVSVGSVFGSVALPMASIGAIIFTDAAAPLDGRTSPAWLVEFSDGARIYAESFAPGAVPGTVSFRWRGAASPARPATDIVQMIHPDWTREYLDAAQFQANVEAVLDQKMEPIQGRNAAGGPLWLAGRHFAHGYGMRPKTSLTLTLPAGAQYLCGWVGVDQHQGEHGNAKVEARLGEKAIYQEESLTARQGAVPLAAPCSGSAPLILTAEAGHGGPFGDNVNWCGLMVLLPKTY